MGRQFKKKATKKASTSKAKGSHKSHGHKKQRKEIKKTSPKTKTKRNTSSPPKENLSKNENYTIVKENTKTLEEKDEVPQSPMIDKHNNPSSSQPMILGTVANVVKNGDKEVDPKETLETIFTLTQLFSFVTFILEMALLPLIIFYTYPYLYLERFLGIAYYIYLILPIFTIFISLSFLPILAYSVICIKLEKMTALHKGIIAVNASIQYFILFSFLFVGIMFLMFNLYHEPDSFSEAIEESIRESRSGRLDIHKLQIEMKCCGTRVKGFKAHELALNHEDNPLNAWYKHLNLSKFYNYGAKVEYIKEWDITTYPFAFNGVPSSCCNSKQLFPECSHIFSLKILPEHFRRIRFVGGGELDDRYDRTGSLNEYDCSYALSDGMRSIMFVIGCICLVFAFLHAACAIVTSILTNELKRKQLDAKEKGIETLKTPTKKHESILPVEQTKKEHTRTQLMSNVPQDVLLSKKLSEQTTAPTKELTRSILKEDREDEDMKE